MKIRVYPKVIQMNPVGLVGEIIFIEFGLNFSRRIHYTLLMRLEKNNPSHLFKKIINTIIVLTSNALKIIVIFMIIEM